jgi:hypothetical protein
MEFRSSDVREVVNAAPKKGHAPVAVGDLASRAASLIFLCVVASCLLVPLAQTIVPIFGNLVPPLEERRQPHPFPAPNLLLQANGGFAGGLNAWFDDRAGFRDLFIRTKNQIDYSLFGTSRKVYVGKDGWLFGRWDPDPIDHLDPAEMTALEGRFVTLASMLREHGIRLIVIGYPDKSQIYPEMAPPEMPLLSPESNHDKLRQFLKSQSTLIFIDAEAILKAEKSRSDLHLYSKTDMHVTQAGQLPVVKEIVAQIAHAEGRSDIQWNEHFKLTLAMVGPGNEGRFLAPLVPIEEKGLPYFDGSFSIGGKEPDGTWYLPDPHVLDRADDGVGRAFDWEFRSRPELCPQRLPGMVLFGNSFSDAYWALGLHRYFCFIRRARDPMSRFKLFYETMPEGTKYFIFEYFAPWLPGDSPPVAQLETHG